jgi:hypothetical protein
MGAEAVLIERDEDIEIVLPEARIYTQIKTRTGALQFHDISDALERFVALEREHTNGHRPGCAEFLIVSNSAPGPALLTRLQDGSWPAAVRLRWPGCGPVEDGLPPATADLEAAVRWCTGAASGIPFLAIAAETLVWKLAARVHFAASGDSGHRFQAADLPRLFEQLVVQLQDFPDPPDHYRPQAAEPELETGAGRRLIVGFSGAGKTAWASQAALHARARTAYFDVADLPAAAVASSLARELAARFLRSGDRSVGSALLPASAGVDLLRAVGRELVSQGSTIVVLDNVHRIDPATLRVVVEAAPDMQFVMLAQPWPGRVMCEAELRIESEYLRGWSLDAVVAEFATAGCRIDAATGTRVISLTAGMPLFVRSAARITVDAYGGDGSRFCEAIEGRVHTEETVQDAILGQTFERLSDEGVRGAALLGLADVPLTVQEAGSVLTGVLREPEAVFRALREMARYGVTQVFPGGRLKLHDAFRAASRGHLRDLDDAVLTEARVELREVLIRSLRAAPDVGRFGAWLRLLVETGEVKTLIDIATDEWFHEAGDPSHVRDVLETASISNDLGINTRFWCLDALALWANQDSNHAGMAGYVNHMVGLAAEGGLGQPEVVSLRMKQMIVAGHVHDSAAVGAAFESARDMTGPDSGLMRLVRYNHAVALFHVGLFDESKRVAAELVEEYYEHLGITPADVFAKNPPDILPLIENVSTWQNDLKHVADCLDLYATVTLKSGERSGLARIHAMKFYGMAGAWRSAVRAGQNVADELISYGAPADARQVLEANVLPALRHFSLLDLLIPVRAQYAVVLAWCGAVEAARAEMEVLSGYKLSAEQHRELRGQRELIEEIAVRRQEMVEARSLGRERQRQVKIGRNAPCPCGSGRKYKKCHGRDA